MKRLWLLFAQTATVLLAAYFVVLTLKPAWLQKPIGLASVVPVLTSPVNTGTPGHGVGYSRAAKAASPTVVSISTSKSPQRGAQGNDPWFRFFFGERGEETPQSGLGSGVIVSPAGYVLTNNHVIEDADEIEVQLSDGRTTRARVVGTDPETDLAVLKIDLDRLPVITLGQSDSLDVGDVVLAIGNPFGVGQTVTSGIVSALGRNQLGINTFENFIQTDAAINPGNSGGALVNTEGHLMGINTAIYSRSGGSMGIGFAIPTSTARQVMEAIVKEGRVTRGWIGVEPQPLTPEMASNLGLEPGQGVIITGVLQGGPAAQAGLRPGDVIAAVAGQPVGSVAALLGAVAALPPGQNAPIDVVRRQDKLTLQVVPAKRPPQSSNR
jgi:Do/DeqQ family serine protease